MLQSVSHSCGDATVVYPLLQQNWSLLDDGMIAVLKDWASSKFAQIEIDSQKSITKVIANLAILLTDFPSGNQAENIELSIACYEIGFEIFNITEDPETWGIFQNGIANAYMKRVKGDKSENLEQAIARYNAALEVRTKEDFPTYWAETQNNLGTAYDERIRCNRAENLEQAIVYYNAALEVRTKEKSPIQWAATQNNLANTYRKRIRGDRAENLEQAIVYYNAALEVRTKEKSPIQWATTQNNLAIAYDERIRGNRAENLEQAIAYYKAALDVRTKETSPIQWATTQNNLATAYSERINGVRSENLKQAITHYNLAQEIYTQEAFPINWATTQNNLAAAYSVRIEGEEAENLEQAIAHYNLVLEIYTQEAFPIDWAMTQNNLAAAYEGRIRGDRTENLDQSITCYSFALEVRTPQNFPIGCLQTANSLGNLLFKQGEWQQAIDSYDLAIQAVETSRIWAVNPQRRQEILSAAINVYHKIVQSYINLDRLDRALEYVERSKARNLVELITNKNLKPQGIDRVNIDRLDELRQAVVNEQIRLQDRAIKQNLISSDNLTPYVHDYSHLQEYQKALDEFIDREITAIDPTFKLIQKVEPIPFKDIQALTDTETCLVQWYIINDNILAFVITPKSLHVWQSTKEALQNLLDWKDAYLKAYKENKTEWIKTLEERLDRFSTILQLDEIVDLIPKSCNKLILVPHYFLHLFPLHTLPLKNGKFLYECFPQGIGYTPSCQLLKLTQERKAERQQEFNNLFAIQNPKRIDTKPLLGANLEIAQVSQHFDLQNSTIIAESQASETMLVELKEKIKSTHCLHFSCHGKFDSQSPLDSALLLADPEGNLGESANLTLAEIFEKLDLQQCRLVTLSACESGVVDPTIISDEYIGIPSGFLFAGSLSVVSTLWTVDPLATTLFITKFYRNLQRTSQTDEVNVTLAANKAQTWLRNLSSKKIAKIKDSKRFQQLLTEISHNQKRDYKKFNDLLEAAVKREPYPFANPYYWTAFTATGI